MSTNMVTDIFMIDHGALTVRCLLPVTCLLRIGLICNRTVTSGLKARIFIGGSQFFPPLGGVIYIYILLFQTRMTRIQLYMHSGP